MIVTKFTISIDRELLRRYQGEAEKRRINFSEFTRRSMDYYIEHQPYIFRGVDTRGEII